MLMHSEHVGGGEVFFVSGNTLRFHGCMLLQHKLIYPNQYRLPGGFPHGSDGKETACNTGDLGSIPGLGRSPGEAKWQPTPEFLLGEFHGQRRLVGYYPWGHKELDMIE